MEERQVLTREASKTPSLSTKELKSISLYVERQQRLDLLLVSVVYAIIIGKTVKDGVLGDG
jgi:hypothetical protein